MNITVNDGVKRHVIVWCLQATHLKYKDTERWKGKDGKKFATQTLIKRKLIQLILHKADIYLRQEVLLEIKIFHKNKSQFNRKIKLFHIYIHFGITPPKYKLK